MQVLLNMMELGRMSLSRQKISILQGRIIKNSGPSYHLEMMEMIRCRIGIGMILNQFYGTARHNLQFLKVDGGSWDEVLFGLVYDFDTHVIHSLYLLLLKDIICVSVIRMYQQLFNSGIPDIVDRPRATLTCNRTFGAPLSKSPWILAMSKVGTANLNIQIYSLSCR